MKHIFQSEDGKVFTSELECAAYEAVIRNNETFEKSRFFSSFGNKTNKYESFTRIIYIAPDEFEKMLAYLSTRMRSIKGSSPSNIYYRDCMTFYAIEDRIEKQRSVVQRAEKELQEIEDALKRVVRNVEEERVKE